MIITIAICLIAALVVLANYKALRNVKILSAVAILAIGLSAIGTVLLTQAKDERIIYSVFFSPFTALILLLISRIYYKKKYGMEIILYMRGFYPVRNEERFVTSMEKLITLLITLLSVAIPILAIVIIS